MGIVGVRLAVLRRGASKGPTGYETWKRAQRIENKGFAFFAVKKEKERRHGTAEWAEIKRAPRLAPKTPF
jgi:hypothetical protein